MAGCQIQRVVRAQRQSIVERVVVVAAGGQFPVEVGAHEALRQFCKQAAVQVDVGRGQHNITGIDAVDQEAILVHGDSILENAADNGCIVAAGCAVEGHLAGHGILGVKLLLVKGQHAVGGVVGGAGGKGPDIVRLGGGDFLRAAVGEIRVAAFVDHQRVENLLKSDCGIALDVKKVEVSSAAAVAVAEGEGTGIVAVGILDEILGAVGVCRTLRTVDVGCSGSGVISKIVPLASCLSAYHIQGAAAGERHMLGVESIRAAFGGQRPGVGTGSNLGGLFLEDAAGHFAIHRDPETAACDHTGKVFNDGLRSGGGTGIKQGDGTVRRAVLDGGALV